MQLRFYYKIKHSKMLLLLSFCSVPSLSIAGDFEVETSVAATTYLFETKKEDVQSQSNQALVVAPSVVAYYSSKRLLTSFAVDHTSVEQKNDIEGADKNYTDYKYNSILALIPNTLNVRINGQQNYRVVNQQQEFVVDKIFAAGDLTKFSSNLASVDFVIPNPKYFGLNIQSSYSKTNSDESIDSSPGLKGDNTAASVQLYQGENIDNFIFNLDTQYNDTSRANFEDFKSTQLQGSLGVLIIKDMSFILTGDIENYDINPENFSRRTDLDTTSYGAGIEWQPRNERKLRLTYNQLDRGDNVTNYVGVNIDWAFSNRTLIRFDYSKKFYGDAYSFDFSHALKSVRSSINYSEQVTSFARAVSTTNPIGLFVCQFGSSDLTDCFQPDSTTYQLQAGEEFRTLSEIGSDISEEIIFRKTGSFNLAYQKRRIKASVTASFSKTEYLESNRVQTKRNIRLNLSYALGRKTDLNFSTTIARNSNNDNETADKLIRSDLNFERALGKNLQLTTGIGIVKRESDIEELNVEDNRLTVGLSYTF